MQAHDTAPRAQLLLASQAGFWDAIAQCVKGPNEKGGASPEETTDDAWRCVSGIACWQLNHSRQCFDSAYHGAGLQRFALPVPRLKPEQNICSSQQPCHEHQAFT